MASTTATVSTTVQAFIWTPAQDRMLLLYALGRYITAHEYRRIARTIPGKFNSDGKHKCLPCECYILLTSSFSTWRPTPQAVQQRLVTLRSQQVAVLAVASLASPTTTIPDPLP